MTADDTEGHNKPSDIPRPTKSMHHIHPSTAQHSNQCLLHQHQMPVTRTVSASNGKLGTASHAGIRWLHLQAFERLAQWNHASLLLLDLHTIVLLVYMTGCCPELSLQSHQQNLMQPLAAVLTQAINQPPARCVILKIQQQKQYNTHNLANGLAIQEHSCTCWHFAHPPCTQVCSS